MKKFCWIFLTTLSLNHAVVADNKLPIGEFSQNRLEGWEHKSFKGETQYRLQAVDGVTVLMADSHAASSGMFKARHSIPTWNTPEPELAVAHRQLNEQIKPGDD